MATINPFAGDVLKSQAFEQGYLAAFSDPSYSQHPPLAADLVDAFDSGVQAGREDRAQPPAGETGSHWADQFEDVTEHAVVHGIGFFIEDLFPKVAGGLLSLVATVVMIPGDVTLKPIEPTFERPGDQEGDSYVALCSQSDHSMLEQGSTNDGYWTGPARNNYLAAATDLKEHRHPGGFVAICSAVDGVCGPVAPVK